MYILGEAEMMPNFEMATFQHQREHMSGRYYFGRGILAFLLRHFLFYFR